MLLKTGMVGSRKDNLSMAEIWYDKPKNFKPITNDNAADGNMIAWTDEPLQCWKPKKE